MKWNLCTCAILLATIGLVASVCAAEQEVIFSDDFSGYTATQPADQAKELAVKWSAVSGHWYVKDGVLHQDAGSFDYGLLVRDLYLRCDYSIETQVQLVGGGAGAGFYWNAADQPSGANANIYAASRLLFSLSRDGYAPGALGELNQRGAPVRALLASTFGMLFAVWLERAVPESAFLYFLGSSLFGGMLASTFGRQEHPRFHTVTFNRGIEITAPQGRDIVAVAEGTVIYADWFKGYGRLIILDHGSGYFTLYAHASDILIKTGDAVSGGQVIAKVGDSGSLEGPQLYFELRHKGKPQDPLTWLRSR